MAQPLRKCTDWDTPTSRDPVEKERRRRSRMEVHWPVSFWHSGTNGGFESVTQDLSSDGFYCVASAAFIPGEIRTCTLAIPVHNRNGGDQLVRVYSRVRVIRVEALAESGKYGIGFRIEDYRFVPPEVTDGASAHHFGNEVLSL